MSRLILLRHGESVWNAENRFTGWTDVDLSAKGLKEAREAGLVLRDAGITVDVAFTSVLKRAIRTLWIVLDELDQMWVPQKTSWRLNERHYGTLQGMNKAEAARQLGEAGLRSIRRGYLAAPPPVEPGDPRFPRGDPRYVALPIGALPRGESLKQTRSRVLPYWRLAIAPRLAAGARVLVVAHGNSLRALTMEIEQLSEAQVERLEIPTGAPQIYDLRKDLSIERRESLPGAAQKETESPMNRKRQVDIDHLTR